MDIQGHPSHHWTIGKSALITDISMCINHYRIRTVGLFCCVNAGVQLGEELINPDLMLLIGHGERKQSEPDFDRGYFVGPPNFIVEVHDDLKSSLAKNRKQLYASAGLQEYLVLNEELSKIEWHRLVKGSFKIVKPDKEGLIKSTSLPGLWIQIPALKKRDFLAVIASIDHGMTRREHHELMDTIWNKDQ